MASRVFSPDGLSPAELRPISVATPLGAVGFTIELGTWMLPDKPSSAWHLPSGAQLHWWDSEAADIGLLAGLVKAQLPVHFPPVTVWSGVWQVVARQRVDSLSLSVELTGLPPDADGAPDTGQWLEAVTVRTAEFAASIGGPDLDLLRQQAVRGLHLPLRWADELRGWEDSTVDYGVRYDGCTKVTWQLPGLEAGEAARLSLAVAWGSPSDDQAATWFAVDMPIDDAIRQLAPDSDEGAPWAGP